MKSFFKDNAVLAAGITLPLLLALVFFIATQIGAQSEEPPKTSVLFTADYYYGYNFEVKGDHLFFRSIKRDQDSRMEKPHLYIYEPLKGVVREVELPFIDNTKESSSAVVKGIGKLNTLEKSPDGFVFESGGRSRESNLMTELFGGGSRYRNQCILRKNSYRHVLPDISSYDCRLIGWVVE